jgi:hypothetical protein
MGVLFYLFLTCKLFTLFTRSLINLFCFAILKKFLRQTMCIIVSPYSEVTPKLAPFSINFLAIRSCYFWMANIKAGVFLTMSILVYIDYCVTVCMRSISSSAAS